jgi:hypothetical protein
MGGYKDRFVRIFGIVAVAMALIANFQNCSDPTFMALRGEAAGKTGNNNGGFDGKAWVSGVCDGTVVARTRIDMYDKGTRALLVRDNCVDLLSPVELPIQDLGFQKDGALLIWRGMIFDPVTIMPTPASGPNIPSGIGSISTVLYCRPLAKDAFPEVYLVALEPNAAIAAKYRLDVKMSLELPPVSSEVVNDHQDPGEYYDPSAGTATHAVLSVSSDRATLFFNEASFTLECIGPGQ